MTKLTLTPQQREVVQNRGGSLLVSAAAGSGKTKVLVERLFLYVTEEHYNIDDFLMITYTKAAAAELRGKIASELSKRLQEDTYAKGKYDATKEKDAIIIDRVGELAKKKGLTRIQISLGWLLTKVTAPVVGATKVSHIEEGVKAIGVQLTPDETAYLEEPYVPHALVGVMRENP